ncbi:S8 family serine peptidase [Longimicrobium terrae]|nr:S8 family serine peptidase [Longimicrobium terrae]
MGVIDTGIDYEHPDLRAAVDRKRSTYCMVTADELAFGSGDYMDRHGHGTQVAGAIAGSGAASDGQYRGIAPDASLVALKIAESERGGFPGYVRSALYAAREQGVQIINLSFMGTGPTNGNVEIAPPWVWPRDDRLAQELKQIAAENRVLCIMAAGNSGKHGEGTMGRYTGAEEVLAVGACDCDGAHCDFSSMGPYYVDPAGKGPTTLRPQDRLRANLGCMKPDFVVPGASMVVPFASGGNRRKNAKKNAAFLNTPYWPTQGTSLAAAIATGLAACALEKLLAGPRMPSDNIGLLLRELLRAAAGEEAMRDTQRYGAGILRWPAIDRQITRFHTDYLFPSKLLRADDTSLMV